MRQTSRVIAIGLVGGERLERLVGLPAFDADHGKAELAQPVEQDRRHASGLENDPTTVWRFRQFAGDRRCRRSRLALANHRAFTVENANMRLIHRDIEASEIVHDRISSSNPGRSYRPSGRAPAHYPMLKNPDFRFDHNWRGR